MVRSAHIRRHLAVVLNHLHDSFAVVLLNHNDLAARGHRNRGIHHLLQLGKGVRQGPVASDTSSCRSAGDATTVARWSNTPLSVAPAHTKCRDSHHSTLQVDIFSFMIVLRLSRSE